MAETLKSLSFFALSAALMSLGLTAADYGVLAAGTVVLVGASLLGRKGSVREMLHRKPAAVRWAAVYGLFLCTLVLGAYGVGYDSSQFIYNQF